MVPLKADYLAEGLPRELVFTGRLNQRKMLYVYSSSWKFDTIGILVVRDIVKIWKKSVILKMSIKYILHNNNAENLLTNCQKNDFPIHNWPSIFLFKWRIWNKLIFRVHRNFFHFFCFKNFIWKFLKSNLTLLILDMFL